MPAPSTDTHARPVPAWEPRLRAYLTSAGLRQTDQRQAIAAAFFGYEGHPNIDELYARIRHSHPHIGQATVYRTIKLLVECGLAHERQFGDGTARYEATLEDDEHHDHLMCRDCGHIFEFHHAEIERLQETIAASHGLRVVDHKMVIYGDCTVAECPRRGHAPRRSA
jgi:Fur family ferric uptake transcriptional regulator